MKNALLTLALVLAASATLAVPVPLLITSQGETELLIPTAVSYRAAVAAQDAYSTTNELGVVTEHPATPEVTEAVVITADYRLTSGSTVVDVELSGIRTTISPASNPLFKLQISLPVASFISYAGEGSDALVSLIQSGTRIIPNGALTDVIRDVAVQVLAAPE